jgi:hypothetical protein
VAISLGKRVSLKILRKISFQVLGGQSGLLGRTVRRLLFFCLMSEIFGKSFEKIRFQADSPRTPGGRSVILNRTGCSSVDRADGPRGPGGRSAQPNGQFCQPLTSRFYRWNSNADNPRGHRGQSARYAFYP